MDPIAGRILDLPDDPLMIRIFGTILAGLLGLAFGSFLNVCLSRWPVGESVVKPRSHCRSCGRTLAWWENVPVVSWVALRGRCRTCQAGISWRYPLVELCIGALWAVAACRSISVIASDRVALNLFWEEIVVALSMMLFVWLVVGLAFLDAEHLWLPDWLTLPALLFGVVAKTVLAAIQLYVPPGEVRFGCWDCVSPWRAAVMSLVGAALAGCLILLIRWTYWLIRHREGIGLGDAKLMAMLGAWLGFSGALLSFGIGVVLGALFALVALAAPAARRESETWLAAKLPLGTFLCIGGIVSALWGQPLIDTYKRWAGF
jgi:leader peptidase (prepilin peptidase) / N-methyltransferase